MEQVDSLRPAVKLVINKKFLRWLVRNQPIRFKAMVASKIATGAWPYQPSIGEAAAIVQTHARLVHAELGHLPKAPSDAMIDRFIARASPERVLAGLDRYTSPPLFAAAAE
jgi:hypothetical protein